MREEKERERRCSFVRERELWRSNRKKVVESNNINSCLLKCDKRSKGSIELKSFSWKMSSVWKHQKIAFQINPNNGLFLELRMKPFKVGCIAVFNNVILRRKIHYCLVTVSSNCSWFGNWRDAEKRPRDHCFHFMRQLTGVRIASSGLSLSKLEQVVLH